MIGSQRNTAKTTNLSACCRFEARGIWQRTARKDGAFEPKAKTTFSYNGSGLHCTIAIPRKSSLHYLI